MEYDIPKGVYDNRCMGLYEGNVVFFDMQIGYLLGNPHARKATPKEVVKLKEQFGELENKMMEEKWKNQQRKEDSNGGLLGYLYLLCGLQDSGLEWF